MPLVAERLALGIEERIEAQLAVVTITHIIVSLTRVHAVCAQVYPDTG